MRLRNNVSEISIRKNIREMPKVSGVKVMTHPALILANSQKAVGGSTNYNLRSRARYLPSAILVDTDRSVVGVPDGDLVDVVSPNENLTEGNAQAYGTLDFNVADVVSPNENTTEGNAQAYPTLDLNVADIMSPNENMTEDNAQAYGTLDLN